MLPPVISGGLVIPRAARIQRAPSTTRTAHSQTAARPWPALVQSHVEDPLGSAPGCKQTSPPQPPVVQSASLAQASPALRTHDPSRAVRPSASRHAGDPCSDSSHTPSAPRSQTRTRGNRHRRPAIHRWCRSSILLPVQSWPLHPPGAQVPPSAMPPPSPPLPPSPVLPPPALAPPSPVLAPQSPMVRAVGDAETAAEGAAVPPCPRSRRSCSRWPARRGSPAPPSAPRDESETFGS